jgi:hypothetical protein
MSYTAHIKYIEARQFPMDTGPDQQGRDTFSVNFDTCIAHPLTKFEEVILQILIDNDLAVLDIDVFVGQGANIPDGDGPYMSIINTGGVYPEETHNLTQEDRPSFQVFVRAKGYLIARDKAFSIYTVLHGIRNAQVVVA